MNRLENLTKAQQCADLLVSDIRDAHRGVCVEKPTVADNLLECALLPLISEACALRDKLAALQRACETGKAVAA